MGSFKLLTMTKILINAGFLEGFVKTCMAKGLDADQTTELFQQHALSQLQSLKPVRESMERVLNAYDGPLTKRAFAQVMQPEPLSKVMLYTIHEGQSLGAQELRRMLPEHQELTEEFKKRAAYAESFQTPGVSETVSRFERLPLSDKIVLLSSMGGVAGGAENVINPHDADEARGRPALKRGLRGAAKGALIGGGAALGSSIGGNLMKDFQASDRNRLVGQLLGGGGGAFLGGRLANNILGQ